MQGLTGLNEGQRKAVLTLSGPLLVLAGAGSGKTRVITCRMAELIRRGTAASKILSVTFTNKAAKEMLERTLGMLGQRPKQRPWISTFHSLCVNILRHDIDKLGYPRDFAILDRGDQESNARGVLREIRVNEKTISPGDLVNSVSRWKSAGVLPDVAAEEAANDKEYLAAMGYRRYQNRLQAAGRVDFDDLLLLTVKLFDEHGEVLAKHQRRFEQVQIDEFQDTNEIQFRIIEALVRGHRNLCVVGDDDQSIYGWRGAEIKHILSFPQKFPGTKVVRLEENYRCPSQVLDLANRLVTFNRDRHQKTLYSRKSSPHEVRVIEYPDEQTEAEMVVREIRFHVQQKGVAARDFAILFRTNEQPRLFESELRRADLRYVLMGSQSFFDRKEVRDVVAYLRVIARPDDETSLLRIINTPPRGLGETSVAKVLKKAVQTGYSFWEAVPIMGEEGGISKKTVEGMRQFQSLLEEERRRFGESPQKLHENLRGLLARVDYEGEIRRNYDDPNQQTARIALLEGIVNSLAEYVQRSESPKLIEFLDQILLSDVDEGPDKEEQAAEDAVKLMTVHSAKGLEFPRVYMVGMEEGLLPHKRSLDDSERAIAEERRLCYVGITRAQEQLTLTWAGSRLKWGKRRKSQPSRFLFEMQSEGEVAAMMERSAVLAGEEESSDEGNDDD